MKTVLASTLVAIPVLLPAYQSASAIKEETSMAGDLANGTNRVFFHEISTTAPAAEIWRLWTDVSTWKDWDKGLKDAKLDGPFEAGAHGKIVPLSGPPARFDIIEVQAGRSYAFETRLPLARLEIRRSLLGTNPTVFRHDVRFKGFLGRFWAGRFGYGFREALPTTMDAIAAIAERSERPAP